MSWVNPALLHAAINPLWDNWGCNIFIITAQLDSDQHHILLNMNLQSNTEVEPNTTEFLQMDFQSHPVVLVFLVTKLQLNDQDQEFVGVINNCGNWCKCYFPAICIVRKSTAGQCAHVQGFFAVTVNGIQAGRVQIFLNPSHNTAIKTGNQLSFCHTQISSSLWFINLVVFSFAEFCKEKSPTVDGTTFIVIIWPCVLWNRCNIFWMLDERGPVLLMLNWVRFTVTFPFWILKFLYFYIGRFSRPVWFHHCIENWIFQRQIVTK